MIRLCCVLLVFTFACGGKYSDAVEVQEDFIGLAGDFVDAMDSADSADKVATAMNNYADVLEDLMPRVREINEKYPELRNPGFAIVIYNAPLSWPMHWPVRACGKLFPWHPSPMEN
ncbi:MAG: hypothetical protein ACLFNW_07035 [Desulfobacterales bacterium]